MVEGRCGEPGPGAITSRVSSPGPPPLHPLPGGMRDLLPAQARRRRALSQAVLEHLDRAGYALVTLPAFEFTDVLERGLGTLDPTELLRFVDPESGQVAAFRPDMTPQIARLVATHLGASPPPLRLCYEGTVVRRRSRRARLHRQLPQAGVELLGVQGLAGDLEVVALLASSLQAAGLSSFLLDLGHAGITRTLLAPLPPALASEVSAALEQKDAATIERRLAAAGTGHVPAPIARALARLPDLHGGGPRAAPHRQGAALLQEGRDVLAGTPAAAALEELADVWARARAHQGGVLEDVLRLDLGEARGLSYYTGVLFHALAEGPGEPVGAGGRYDDLLARFGRPLAAVGFALNLDALAWALGAAGVPATPPTRVLVTSADLEAAHDLTASLRALGVAAVTHLASVAPDAYASAWGFSHVLSVGSEGGARLTRVASGFVRSIEPVGVPAACARAALDLIQSEDPTSEGDAPCPPS